MNALVQVQASGFRALPPGSLIGIVAPAGPVAPERLARVEPLFAAAGWRVRLYPGCRQRHADYLAGTDEQRLADLHAAFADDEVAAVHCLRGGYGCMRLLDRIDTALLRARPKLLIGYSDITALQALLAREGLPSLHAPMPGSDLVLPGREAERDALFALLREGCAAGTTWAPALDGVASAGLCLPGVADGLLAGGNLSLVAALLGTRWAWPLHGALLFLEDISEEPYRVDRLLTQLRLAGAFEQVAGVLLGSFTGSGSPRAVLEELLLPLCRERGLPLLGGWPAGHASPNRPLPMGLRARLDAGAGTLTLLQPLLQPAAPAAA